MADHSTPKTLQIGGRRFRSRLFMGTGKFGSSESMAAAIQAAETQLVTVALKRIDRESPHDPFLQHLRSPQITLLPNTSGARTAKEAVLAAQLAREALETNWVKLEIHPDPTYLLPDPVETYEATRILAADGFTVLP